MPRRSHWLLVVVSIAAVVIALCAAASPAGAEVGPRQIDAFLLARGSPLAGEGTTFCAAGRRYGVDPAFLVAITGAESNFGQLLVSDGSATATYNAFNWFWAPTRLASSFTSWSRAIATVAQGLSGPLYYGAGRYAVADIAPVYCPQGTSAWISNVTAFMAELGADPGDTRWAAGLMRTAPSSYDTGTHPRAPATDRPATIALKARSHRGALHAHRHGLRLRDLAGRHPAARGPRWAIACLRCDRALHRHRRRFVRVRRPPDARRSRRMVWLGRRRSARRDYSGGASTHPSARPCPTGAHVSRIRPDRPECVCIDPGCQIDRPQRSVPWA